MPNYQLKLITLINLGIYLADEGLQGIFFPGIPSSTLDMITLITNNYFLNL